MGQANGNETFTKHLLEWVVDYSILQNAIKGSLRHDTYVELGEAIIHYRVA